MPVPENNHIEKFLHEKKATSSHKKQAADCPIGLWINADAGLQIVKF